MPHLTTDDLAHLRQLLAQADLPAGPFTWERCYQLLGGKTHWALCDPASTAAGRVTDATLVLLASYPTWSGEAPATWSQPLSTSPRLALIAALLTHAEALLARQGTRGEGGALGEESAEVG